VLVPIEAMLLPLALAGVVAVQRARRLPLVVVACAAIAFPVAQAVALLAHPAIDGAHPFLRPGSEPRYGVNLTSAGVDAAVREARACPASLPYSGPAFIGFVAERGMPAGQPDHFLPARSSALRDVWRRIVADKPSCPWPPPRIP
jgi:hypothetical protein